MKNRAGMERIITAKINYLASHTNHQLFLLTYEQRDCPLPFELDKSVRYISVENPIPQRKDYSIYVWLKKYLSARRQFRDMIKQQIDQIRPDIIVCNVYSFSVIDLIIKIASHRNISTIIESHTKLSSTFISHKFSYNRFLYFISRLWDKYILYRIREASTVVALTKQDAKDWEPLVNRIEIIPNFISIELKRVKDYSAKRVISAGRYAYEKGYDMLLLAWSKIIKDYPGWELHVFGDGDVKPYLQLSDRLNISDSVFLHTSTSDIAEEFYNSSIFVMSSRYEGFGLVLAEAMSCGLACISFDCPYGPRNIINNKQDGILVAHEDVNKLSNSISLLMEDENIRKEYGLKASANLKRYSKDNIMQSWIELFKNISKQ